MSALLDAWLSKVRFEDIDDALDELSGSLEELVELATGDRHPGSPGTLAMEISREQETAEKALGRLRRAFAELQDGAA